MGQSAKKTIKNTSSMIEAAALDREEEANKQKLIYEDQLEELKNNRQDIVNPYAGITNEFANLGVATKAAQFQAEEADIALANTLDALAATGAGAGGATALAQAALQSKRDISKTLQVQETQNQKLAAEGATNVARLQAEGEKFVFQAQENREQQELDRAAGLLDEQRQREMSAQDTQLNAQLTEEMARSKKLRKSGQAFGFIGPF
jgi:hypothetical protein